MDAIVLVEGLGTRLKSVVADIPRSMTPVGAVPFLDIVLEKLLAHSIVGRVVLAVSYGCDAVQNYFGDRAYNRKIVYAIEKSPLGTGGSILNALAHTRSQEVLVLKGNTLFDVDVHKMVEQHRQYKADLTLALKPMQNFSRYSTIQSQGVLLQGDCVAGFGENQYHSECLINSGIYLLNQTLFDGLPAPLPHQFSFETDFLEIYFDQLKVYGFTSLGNFIDIDIPEDYQRAQHELSKSSYAQTA